MYYGLEPYYGASWTRKEIFYTQEASHTHQAFTTMDANISTQIVSSFEAPFFYYNSIVIMVDSTKTLFGVQDKTLIDYTSLFHPTVWHKF